MKVPHPILNRLDDHVRKALSSNSVDYASVLSPCDRDLKERTRKVLWSMYEQEGYHKFMSVVSNMRKIKNQKFSDLVQVKGEIAEVVLEIIVHQYIKEYRLKDWHMFKGLILEDETNPSFSTELDLVLVTPMVVTIVEIKSFNGEKTLTEDCTLTAKNGTHELSKDIFAQNKLHIATFWDNFKHCAKSNQGVIKSVLFSFSAGSIVDKRARDKIAVMPYYTEETVAGFLKAVHLLEKKRIWEVDKLVKEIERTRLTTRSAAKHIEYVRSLHPDELVGD